MKIFNACLKKIYKTTYVMGLLISPFVFAQSEVVEALNPNWLSNEVLQSNAGLTAQELRVKARRELVESASALDDPRISYSVAPSSIGDQIPSNFGNALGVRQVIQLNQSFPWPGKLSLRTDLAATQVEIAQYSYEELQLSLVHQSRSLWAQLWYVEQALLTNSSHQQLLEELEEVSATRYANGLGLQQDLLQIQTDLVEAAYQESALNQQRRRIYARINSLINRSPSSELGVPVMELEEPDIPAFEVLENWMYESQPQILGLQAESNAAFNRTQLAEKDDFPDIQLNIGYNEIMNDSALRFQVGVSINIPFDFGKRSSRKAATRFEYNSSLADINLLKNDLSAELEQELSRYEEFQDNIALLETELIPIAEQTFTAASANYEGGGGDFAALTAAQQKLLDIRLRLVQMRAEKFMTVTEIDRLSGGKLWPVEDVQ
tara:strand:- start:1560 stop:2864 length:1305 start_codon:yes stop_codon:yes gene_type:complete